MPRLYGSRRTTAPRARATSAVRSEEPSSTTTIARPSSNARNSSTTPAMHSSSLYAGTIATRRSSRRSATGRDRLRHPGELEQAPRAVRVRVLVEHALSRAAAKLLGLSRIVEQLAIRGERLVGRFDDDELAPRIEPAIDALVGVRDDRGAARRELERARSRRGTHGRVRAARDVQVDPRRRDRSREDVERDIADRARVSGVAAEVTPAEHEVDLGHAARRPADHRLDPLAAELVAVPVEEDVVFLLDVVRAEQIGIGAPED